MLRNFLQMLRAHRRTNVCSCVQQSTIFMYIYQICSEFSLKTVLTTFEHFVFKKPVHYKSLEEKYANLHFNYFKMNFNNNEKTYISIIVVCLSKCFIKTTESRTVLYIKYELTKLYFYNNVLKQKDSATIIELFKLYLLTIIVLWASIWTTYF